jgi:hypothetical protein
MTEGIAQPKRTGLLIWLIVSQLVTLITFVPWLYTLLVSGLFFAFSPYFPLFVLILFFPAIPIAMVVGAWMAYKRGKNMRAAVLSGLAILPLLLLNQILTLTVFSGLN